MTAPPRRALPLLAALALAAAACSGRSSQGYAAFAGCKAGETCGYAHRAHWTGNCCGYALGPFRDAESCRSACTAQANQVGRSLPGCAAAGRALCDAAVDDWLPCDASSGARQAGGGCALPSGETVACVCR